jgi:hypothetical protein
LGGERNSKRVQIVSDERVHLAAGVPIAKRRANFPNCRIAGGTCERSHRAVRYLPPPNSPNSSLNYIFWQNVRLSQPIFLLFQFFSAEIAFRESNQQTPSRVFFFVVFLVSCEVNV